jgi:hypothetical protein
MEMFRLSFDYLGMEKAGRLLARHEPRWAGQVEAGSWIHSKFKNELAYKGTQSNTGI